MTQPKIVFLDIHGVLGRQAAPKLGDREIEAENVAHFNRIVDETGAKIVVTSSLRGLMHSGHMDIHGFAALLRTHGVHGDLFSCTRANPGDWPRWKLIVNWLSQHQHGRWVILDDNPEACPPFNCGGGFMVQTRPDKGLDDLGANAAICWLNG